MKLDRLKEKIETWENESTKREKFLVFLLTIGLPTLLFYQFYYAPTKDKIKTLSEDIKNLELEMTKLESFTKRERELLAQLKERKIFLEEVKAILPTEEEIPKLLKDVSLKAKKNNIEILSFTPKGEEKRDYYNIIAFDIHIVSTLHDLLKFLNEVEGHSRLITLNFIEITPSDKENKLMAKGTFKTFKFTGQPLQAGPKK